jgi:hypothetical protein
LIGFAVGDEPIVAAEPSVAEPDAIVRAIVSSIAQVKARTPKNVCEEEKEE